MNGCENSQKLSSVLLLAFAFLLMRDYLSSYLFGIALTNLHNYHNRICCTVLSLFFKEPTSIVLWNVIYESMCIN